MNNMKEVRLPIETTKNGDTTIKVCVEDVYRLINRLYDVLYRLGINSETVLKSIHKEYKDYEAGERRLADILSGYLDPESDEEIPEVIEEEAEVDEEGPAFPDGVYSCCVGDYIVRPTSLKSNYYRHTILCPTFYIKSFEDNGYKEIRVSRYKIDDTWTE